MKITMICSLAASLVLLGCSNPADNVPAAAVSSETNTTATAAEPGATEKVYAASPGSGSVEFLGSKVTGSHKGGFRNFAGEFRVANGQLIPNGSKVVIDMNSTWSDSDRLTGHLKNQDFFDVPRFPTSTFVSTAIESRETNSLVTGNLTLHGVTKQISFPAQIQVSDEAVSINANFLLNRFDFDIKYAGKADDLIRKEVVLKLNMKATPGKADFQSIEAPAKTVSAPASGTSG